MTSTSDQPERGPRTAEVPSAVVEISNAVVQITRQYTGRGPTTARTHINDDLVTCVLRGCLTKGEQTLVESGRTDPVLRTRKQLQAVMRRDLVDAVERITGRDVLAFMSDQHVDPDVAAMVFLLKPRLAPAPDLSA